jgi:hypothetical protein
MRGGMEALYDDVPNRRLHALWPRPPRTRIHVRLCPARAPPPHHQPVVTEAELYDK